jgi:hypothetical protein
MSTQRTELQLLELLATPRQLLNLKAARREVADRLLAVARGEHPLEFRPPAETPPVADVADGALPGGFAAALSGLRTDLDRFTPEEASLLMYHGYWATHVRVRQLHPTLAVESPEWREYEGLDEMSSRRLLALLHAGANRRVRR